MRLPNQPADTYTCSSMEHDEPRLALDFRHTLVYTHIHIDWCLNLDVLCAFPLKKVVLIDNLYLFL